MQFDGMYIFVDFINYVFEMFIGKLSSQKVKNCELLFGRFEGVWKEESDFENRFIKKRKIIVIIEFVKILVKEVKFYVLWVFLKDGVKEVDKRVSEIVYGQINDIIFGLYFFKFWILRIMNFKLQVNNVIYKLYLVCLDMVNYFF